MKISGIIPPMVTPFTADGRVDIDALCAEAIRLKAAGVHGVSFAGSTGEGAQVSDEEISLCVSAIRKVIGSNFPLVCGIIRNSSIQAISASKAAKDAGADALMITPTHYLGATPEGNAAYYEDIAAAVKMPIIIYNVIPGNPVLPEHIPMLVKNPYIIGIKQANGGVHAVADMVLACKDKITVFGAQDDVMFLSYLVGAQGAISAVLTLYPELCMEEWNAVQNNDVAKAREIHERIMPVWRQIEGKAFPGRLKAALSLRGIKTAGFPRRPILPCDEQTVDRIRDAMMKNNLLD